MIVDSSAILAILLDEPERDSFIQLIVAADVARMSTASYLEIALRIDRSGSPLAARSLDQLLAELSIVLEPVTVEQAYLARAAFGAFGRGRHPAALNFGDCFVYALARARGEPLLFKGQDFGRTDLAIAAVG